MTTISKIETENIFTITQRGDRNIHQAHMNAIILVGLTRVGKSTVFNWIQKKPMVGKGQYNTYYLPVVDNDSGAAKVGNSLASVTLAPNIIKNFQATTSLVDMAGYEDTRNYVGVIGVSYFLKALFEKVRKVKFVIVFDENKLKQQTCGGLIKTFQGFINMFKFQLMTPQIKERLKKSLSLVITKSEKPQDHFGLMSQILQKMKDQTFLFENKPLIIELLEYSRDSARREAFKKARNDQQPTQCNFIDRFNNLGWDYFDMESDQALVGESLISLPFLRDYQKLKADQKELFQKELNKKVVDYMSYSEILKSFIENFVANWDQCLQGWQSEKKFDLSSFKLTNLFDQVRRFIKKNDFYSLDEIISVQLKVNYERPSLIDSINSILSLQKIVEKVSQIQDFENVSRLVVDPVTGEESQYQQVISLTFKDVMQKFKGYFAEMIKIIKNFATSQEEDILLQKTNFILQRGFRQFQKLYELDRELIHDIKIKLSGNCNAVFQTNQIKMPWNLDFIEKFVKKMDQTLLAKVFPNIQSLKVYEEFFSTYSEKRIVQAQQQSREQEDRCNIFFSQQKNSIETAKADLLLGLLQKEKACLCYFNALKNIIQLYQTVSESSLHEQHIKEQELNRLSMRKLKIIKKIVSVLKALEAASSKYKKFALQLTKHHNMIEDSCKIYQLLIETASNKERLTFYQEYADLCLQWGRLDDANKLLQKKLAIEQDSFESYMATVSQLREIQTSKDVYRQRYSENLQKLGRLSIQDEHLERMMQSFSEEIQRLIRILDNKKETAKE